MMLQQSNIDLPVDNILPSNLIVCDTLQAINLLLDKDGYAQFYISKEISQNTQLSKQATA